MGIRSSGGITQLLERWSSGDETARDELMPLVYDELRRLASTYLRHERREHTLQPTALVNELFLKFSEQHSMSWQNRAQFFGVAAQFMRRILVDYARAHYASKRGGDRYCVSLKNVAAFGAQPDADLLALHDVLNELEKLDCDQARIVELKFFGGLTIKEIAEVMRSRGNRPLFLIDIAVPRDIEANVHHLDNVFLYNVDHLETLVRENVRNREHELIHCREIIAEQAAALLAKVAPRTDAPTPALAPFTVGTATAGQVRQLAHA